MSAAPEEATFLSWISSHPNGVVSPAIAFHQFADMGRGMVALADIPPDTLLFTLPREYLLTTSTSALPPLLPPTAWAELNGWTPLILCILYEYAHPTTSVFKPYFDVLPPPGSFDSLMFWSEEELKELKGSLVLTKIGKDEADEEYANVVVPFLREHKEVFGDVEGEGYTLERFHWAGSLILSRSFHVESGAGEDSDEEEDEDEEEVEKVEDVAMVPLADHLNAKSGCDNAKLFYEPTTLSMISTDFIPTGSQIFNTYADPPNSDLLRRYGHVDDVNANDLVEVGLETIVDLVGVASGLDEAEREKRAEWLLEIGVDDSFTLTVDEPLPSELLSSIALFLLPTSSPLLEKAYRKEAPPKAKIEETQIAEWVIKVLELRAGEFETSTEDDEALLASSEALPLRKRMAVVVRLGEKKILAHALAVAKEALAEGEKGGKKDKDSKKRKGESSSGEKRKKVAKKHVGGGGTSNVVIPPPKPDLEKRDDDYNRGVHSSKAGLLFGKEDEQSFGQSRVEWIIMAAIALLAAAFRFYKIDHPAGVVFDEVHFGKFASYYIRREYFFDVHPPLAKLLLAFAGWVIGYDGHCEFENIGDSYIDNKVPYVGLRVLPAILGSLIPPVVYGIMRESGYPRIVGLLSASLVLIDNAHIVQTRLILLDAPLVLFMAMSFYSYIKY
ncbi:SET domain-containing protein 6 [Pseudohyphozyma bogoriensis]|nr:SET domain-containing protein 6 [Pseudohyphozyma bogoriensis]